MPGKGLGNAWSGSFGMSSCATFFALSPCEVGDAARSAQLAELSTKGVLTTRAGTWLPRISRSKEVPMAASAIGT